MSIHNDAAALAKREPTISKADCEAISKAARAELRDRFAMAVLAGLAVNSATYRPEYAAWAAYQYADAMMKARGE
jgi:hypothetical protein